MWSIKLKSKNYISESEKELITDYACSEGDNVILHEVLETSKSVELILEGKKVYVKRLFSFLKYDLKYDIRFFQLN